MRKNEETHQKQENEDVLPGSIIAVVPRGVNRLRPFKQTANVGPDALERGDRAVGSSRDYANQCSARLGAGTAGTNGVPTLARVVSGRETQKREKAAGTGCDLVLCAFVAVDRASVGKREPTTGAGFGCDNIGRALDNFIHQRGGVLCGEGEPPEVYIAHALGGWVRVSLGSAHRS